MIRSVSGSRKSSKAPSVAARSISGSRKGSRPPTRPASRMSQGSRYLNFLFAFLSVKKSTGGIKHFCFEIFWIMGFGFLGFVVFSK